MKRGFHWLAQMPDGEYVVLYADPVLKTMHHQRGGSFESVKEARAYARKGSFELGEPPAPPEVETTTKLASRIAILGTVIKDKLDDLFEANPEGVPVTVIMDMFDVEYTDALHAVRWLTANNHAKWRRIGNGDARKFLVPVDAPDAGTDTEELLKNHKLIFDLLVENADQRGIVRVSTKDICAATGVPRGSVPYILHELGRKHLIEIASMGFDKARTDKSGGGVVTTFRVPAKDQGNKAMQHHVVTHRRTEPTAKR